MTSSGSLNRKPQSAFTPQTQRRKISRHWLTALIIATIGSSGFTVWQVRQQQAAQRQEAQLQAQVIAPTAVTALGRLEPQGELVNLTAPTSTQESRVDQVLVEVGDRTQIGDIVAVLDGRDRLTAALQKAKQQVDIAQAKLAQVKAGAKSGEIQAQQAEISRIEAAQLGDIDTQQATIARLEAELNNAALEYQRYESLYQRGAVSASERDARQLTYTTAQRRLEEAKAGLSRTQSTGQRQLEQARATLDRIGEVRPVDVALAEAEVRSAEASVAEAQANLDQVEVKSPVAGQVIKVHTRPGEKITEEGIATLGQTAQMMVVAEVYQDSIGKIEPGQPVTITTPVLDTALLGTVKRIGLQVERQQVVNEDPAANIDAKVVEVYIQLDNTANKKVDSLTNLQVTATIQTDR